MRQSFTAITRGLPFDSGLKPRPVDARLPQVIHADMKAKVASTRKQHFQSLRSGLGGFKRLLLFGITTLRQIPIAVILQHASTGAGDAPMTDFMQGAGKEATRENYPVMRAFWTSRKIQGFIATADQAGTVGVDEQTIKQGGNITEPMLRGAN